ATQLGVERRRTLARALSLAGAETRQIRTFVMLEGVTASAIGLILGYGVFLLARPLLALLQVGGRTTFAVTLKPPPALILAVACFVLVAAVVASVSGTRRLGAEPLAKRQVRSVRTIGLLLCGLGAVGLALGASFPTNTDAPHPLALLGMILVAVGIALIGQIVIAATGRRIAARTRDGITLLAARRMDRSPAEVNRPLIAVVTVVFVVTAFFTITGTLVRSSNYRYDGIPKDSVLVESASPHRRQLAEMIDRQPGIQAVATQTFVSVSTEGGNNLGIGIIADCAAIQEVVEVTIGECTAGVFAAPDSDLALGTTVIVSTPPFSESGIETALGFGGDHFEGAYPAALIIDAETVQGVFTDVATVGQVVASYDPATLDIESLRTSVVSAFPTAQVRSIAEINYDQSVSAREVRALASIGLVTVLAIAAFSLSVGTASDLLQRRDAFALLRASGVLPREIRRLVALESTAPLAISAAAGAFLGVASGAAVAISAGTDPSIPWPTIGLVYLAAVLLGGLVWAAFAPSLDRLTSPTGLRFE
ncbi:MAG: FtsX-like permease family protein, partial [Acidimicrobiia bacterium]